MSVLSLDWFRWRVLTGRMKESRAEEEQECAGRESAHSDTWQQDILCARYVPDWLQILQIF